MTFLEQLGWLVPHSEWDAHLEQTEIEWGDTKLYAGFIAGLAMKEYMDADRGASAEATVDRVVRAGGACPRDTAGKRKSGVESLANEEKMRVHSKVHPPTKEAFASFAKEHTDDSPGVALAYALREYWAGGRWGRVETKLERVADDAEALLSEASSSGSELSTKEKRTIAMVQVLGDMHEVGEETLTRHDFHRAIAKVSPDTDPTEELSDYLDKTYRAELVERVGYESSPENEHIYVPSEDVKQQRREQAERESAAQMDAIDVAGQAWTDGGTDQ